MVNPKLLLTYSQKVEWILDQFLFIVFFMFFFKAAFKILDSMVYWMVFLQNFLLLFVFKSC